MAGQVVIYSPARSPEQQGLAKTSDKPGKMPPWKIEFDTQAKCVVLPKVVALLGEPWFHAAPILVSKLGVAYTVDLLCMTCARNIQTAHAGILLLSECHICLDKLKLYH